MADDFSQRKFKGESTIGYKDLVMEFLFKATDKMPTMVASGGFQPNELVSIRMMISTFNGMIRTKARGKTFDEYTSFYNTKMESIKRKFDLKKLWGMGISGKEEASINRLEVVLELQDLFEYQLTMLTPLGLADRKVVAVINAPAPNMYLEDYYIEEGDLDYASKDLGLHSTIEPGIDNIPRGSTRYQTSGSVSTPSKEQSVPRESVETIQTTQQ